MTDQSYDPIKEHRKGIEFLMQENDRLADRVKQLEEALTIIVQIECQSKCSGADGRWWYRHSLAMHEAEKLLGWPTTKPQEPNPEQEKGFADLFAAVEKEKAEQLALTQRLAGMEAALREAHRGLHLAGIICDAVPTRAHELKDNETLKDLGLRVNQGQYQIIRDAEQKAKQALEGKS